MLDIEYSEPLSLDVEIEFTAGLKGTLHIASGMSPKLSVDNQHFHNPSELLGYLKSPPTIIRCNSKGNFFTLCQNLSAGYTFLPTYVISGSEVGNVVAVDMSISGLYTFFNGISGFWFENSLLSKEIIDEFVNVPFFIRGEEYSFVVNHTFKTEKVTHKTTIIEDAVVRIEKKEGFISLDEAKNIITKVKYLFSLLLGYDLSIKKTWLKFDNEKYSSFYFHAFSNPEEPFEHAHECFVMARGYIRDDEWTLILNNAFNGEVSEEINDVWVRLVSTFSYKGYWEYDILGVVSLLDSYSGKYHEKFALKKLGKAEFKKLKRNLVDELEKFKATILSTKGGVNDKYQVIDSIIASLGYIRNTNAQTFKITFDTLLNSIDEDIKKLIDFNANHFKTIKKIRDLAAHGQPMTEGILNDIQQVMVIKEKIRFLLLYIALTSIGFSKELFIKSCISSHHRIKIGARLDSFMFDKLTKYAIFVDVSKEQIDLINGFLSSDIYVVYHAKSLKYSFQNETLVSLGHLWWSEELYKKYENKVDYIYENYKTTNYFGVENINKAYFMNGDKHVALSNLVMLYENN